MAEGRLGETSDLEGGGLRSRALGILGRLYGTTEGEAHGILVGVGPSLHCSRRLIHCRLPQTAFCPSASRAPFFDPPSIVVARLASFPTLLRLIGCGIDRSMIGPRFFVDGQLLAALSPLWMIAVYRPRCLRFFRSDLLL